MNNDKREGRKEVVREGKQSKTRERKSGRGRKGERNGGGEKKTEQRFVRKLRIFQE